MLCIDSLKYDYYLSVAIFISDLVDGAKMTDSTDDFRIYKKCVFRYYTYYYRFQKFIFSVAIDKEIRLEFKLKNNKEAINLYNVLSVRNMLIETLKP